MFKLKNKNLDIQKIHYFISNLFINFQKYGPKILQKMGSTKPGIVDFNKELMVRKHREDLENRIKIQWRKNWSGLRDIIEANNKELREYYLKEVVPFYKVGFENWKVSKNIRPQRKRFDETLIKSWPAIAATENSEYGRFGWLPLEPCAIAMPRRSYFTT